MSEKNLAADLQATKDDSTEWGEPETSPAHDQSKKPRLAAMVSVRLAPDELEAVQQRAQDMGLSVSAYLRALAVGDVGRSSRPAAFAVTISNSGTYSTRVANPWLMSDGRRLATSQ